MPGSPHDAIIVVLDIGKSVSHSNDEKEQTFFQQSKECVSWIIQRKLISQSADALGLILIGCDDVNNSWARSGYKNLCCKFDLQQASWDMLKFVEVEVDTTENESDWIGALVVSIEMLKIYDEFNDVRNKKIVFLSDFSCPSITDNVDAIIKNLKDSNVNVTIIGLDDILSLNEEGEEDAEPTYKKKRTCSSEHAESQKLISEIWRKMPEQVVICPFESALKQLCSYTRKSIRKTPWNCILDIGNVKINISMFKKTDPKSAKKFTTKYVKTVVNEDDGSQSQASGQVSTNEAVPVVRDKVMFYKHESGSGGEFVDVEVNEEDTIEGFRYGVSVVPFSDEDKAVMNYKPGSKSFSVLGFTDISSVPFYLLSGECSYMVLPRERDENAEVAFSAIVQAMKEMECLAIVRKVYSNDRGLSLGILYPFIEEIIADETDETFCKECLLYVDLAFEEEVKSINFPSLDKLAENLTQEQYDVIDELIEEMDLMNADKGLRGEPCEAFDLANLHDIKEQFFHHCVIQKGLFPEKPLPKSLPKEIENHVRLPKSIENKIQSLVNGVKARFKVHEVVRTPKVDERGQTSASIPVNTTHGLTDSISEETESPLFSELSIAEEKSFVKRTLKSIFANNFPKQEELNEFVKTCTDREENPSNIVNDFKDIISNVRSKYLDRNPDLFNWWMEIFKGFSYKKEGLIGELWDVVVTENLGLISKEENKYSIISQEEAERYLNSDLTQSLPCYSPAEKFPSFGSLPEIEDDLLAEQMAIDSIF